jgi:hypothetical protein
MFSLRNCLSSFLWLWLDNVRAFTRLLLRPSTTSLKSFKTTFDTDVQTKLPSNRLCLVYEFETPVREALTSAHDAACKMAAAQTGIKDTSVVQATASILSDATLATVHQLEFQPDFHVANGGPTPSPKCLYKS